MKFVRGIFQTDQSAVADEAQQPIASLLDLVFRVSWRDRGLRPRFEFCRNHEFAKAGLGGEQPPWTINMARAKREPQIGGTRTETW